MEVMKTLGCWLGLDHRYFKVEGVDGAIYMLRHDGVSDTWELTLFKGKREGGMKKKMSGRREATLHQILHQLREKVVVDIENQLGRELDPHKIDVAMDTGDWAAFELSEGIDYKLLEMLYKNYKEIADAFRRLEAGTYGVCESCGVEIPAGRLNAEPLARHCVPCLNQIEALEEAEGKTRKISSF